MLCLLLMRGGLLINLKGKGLELFFLTWVPQTVEASAVALITHFIFDVPILIGYCMGYTLACIGPAVLDMCMFRQLEKGLGK